jgi:hypothetical protein
MGICVFFIGVTQKACLYFYKSIQKVDVMYLRVFALGLIYIEQG